MLKFFRKYLLNRYFLVAAGCVLMVVFLLPAGGQMFAPDPSGEAVGTLDGETLRFRDQQYAAAQLSVLRSIGLPAVGDPFVWMLAKQEAARVGLSASEAEVNALLRDVGLDTEQKIARQARRMDQSIEFLKGAVKHWFMVTQLREMLYGLGHLSLRERGERMQRAQLMAAYGQQGVAMGIVYSTLGEPRTGETLRQRFIQDLIARLGITAVRIPAANFAEDAPEPTDEQLQQLFEKFRDDLPGEGEPYGLGYRRPAQVRLEYLEVPFSKLREAVTVEEVDALEYYRENKLDFMIMPEGDPGTDETPEPRQLSYEEARDRVIRQLQIERAEALGARIVSEARARLIEDARSLKSEGGFRIVPDDWEPMPLSELANDLQERFDILPTVRRLDDRPLQPTDLTRLEGIRDARTADQRNVPFPDYVMSAKEIAGPDASPLRLQARMPSQVMKDEAGSYYLFRLIEAAPPTSPESLEEVRSRVVADARRVNAYEKVLLERQGELRSEAVAVGLNDFANNYQTQVVNPPLFTRRQIGPAGTLTAPVIAGLGQSDELVDQLFERALVLYQSGSPESQPTEARTVAVPVPSEMALVVARIDRFLPVTREMYDEQAGGPFVTGWLNQQFFTGVEGDPFSREVIEQRLGFESAFEEEAEPTDSDEPAEDAEAQDPAAS